MFIIKRQQIFIVIPYSMTGNSEVTFIHFKEKKLKMKLIMSNM